MWLEMSKLLSHVINCGMKIAENVRIGSRERVIEATRYHNSLLPPLSILSPDDTQEGGTYSLSNKTY